MEIYAIVDGHVLPYILDPNFEKYLPIIPSEVRIFTMTGPSQEIFNVKLPTRTITSSIWLFKSVYSRQVIGSRQTLESKMFLKMLLIAFSHNFEEGNKVLIQNLESRSKQTGPSLQFIASLINVVF